MNLSREFTHEADGKTTKFHVTYDPVTHFFKVVEDDQASYALVFDMATREWKTAEGSEPSIAVSDLAHLVQQSFGVFV